MAKEWNKENPREKELHRSAIDSMFENTYLCMVSKENWDKAWEVGTITKDDFIPVIEDKNVREDMARRLHRIKIGGKG